MKLPKEILEKMCDNQVAQGNLRNPEVFKRSRFSHLLQGGFNWEESPEKCDFWSQVLDFDNHDLFYQKYPKND